MREESETPEPQEEEELYEHHRLVVEPKQSPLRIDKWLMNRMENTSRNRIQNAAAAGNILVNEKKIKPSYKVRGGDVISIVLPEPVRDHELVPENIPIEIIYEDDDLLIVNKIAGMVVHPAYGHYTGTLMNALAFHFQNLQAAKNKPQTENAKRKTINDKQQTTNDLRPGLVHRIDKNTSGLLVIAKTEMAMTKLAKEFFDRTVDRKYLALVWGDFKEEKGTIEGNIGRNLKDRKIMDVFPDGEHGKHAVTHYKVVERFGYVTLVECKLETGRTHQIRVHMKHIGHPIFNDDTYGGNKILKGTTFAKYSQFVENCFRLIPRQALHAKSMGFIHPSTGKKLFFESDLPEDMKSVVEKWRKYSLTK